MNYQPLTEHNIMELWLFSTCNFRCGYCGLVTSGDVLKTEELSPYRDPKYIETLLRFFRDNRPLGRPWNVMLTGGEPTLMPNISMFTEGLGRQGDSVAIYSNMSVPLNKVFSEEALKHISYIEASFHPDWHMGSFEQDRFFEHVALAKRLEVPVLVRFVGAPQLLSLIPMLQRRCAEIGVTLMPTTLFNPEYPQAYTTEERATLSEAMVGYSSLIQLDGGMLMHGRKCEAADRIFAARLHQGGDVTPCISTDKPVLGNVFANTLKVLPGLKGCMRPDQICSCDVHFQQRVVDGADDSTEFEEILAGRGVRRGDDYAVWKADNGIATSDRTWVGQGVSVVTKEDLLRKAPAIQRTPRNTPL
jgi:MoaA/NifB/PqqE/SkfB family radical SAM enzyme